MAFKPIRNASFLMLIALLYGCASHQGPDLRSKKLRVEKSIINGERDSKEKTRSEQQQTQEEALFRSESVDDWGGITKLEETAQEAPELSGEPISFSTDEMIAKEFIAKTFGELLGINYVLAPELAASQDTITLNISDKLERPEFYNVVIKTLQESGISSYRKDNILYFSPAKGSDKKNAIALGIGNSEEDIPQVAGAITHIVPYVFSSSRNVSNILSKLSTAKVTVNSLQKLIILEGERTEVVRALKIINMLDVPRAYGREIRLFEFAHIAPEEGVEQIKELLEQDGLRVGSSDGDVSFVSLARINSFVAYASNEQTIERIAYWAKKIDAPLAGDERQYFVYKPKYAKAEDMLDSMQQLLQSNTTSAPRSRANEQQSDSASGRSTSGTSADQSLRFSLDKQQNALIFYTTKDEYRLVENLLEKMDVLPGQVILDVTILEVTLTDEMSSGIDWLYKNTGMGDEVASLNLTSSTGSLVGSVISGNWQANLQWKDSQDDARVISRPYFIVRDGESATISSGDQIPIITQTVENIGDNSSVSNSVQYRSTGVNVSITPIINSQGVVTLSVSMSVSDGKPNELGGTSSPTITNRSISTEVLSADGQTIALGGLIQERKSDTENGVPVLGDIPVFGNLFRSKVDSLSRTELVMLITTKVVKSSSEVDEFSEAISELYSTPIIIK